MVLCREGRAEVGRDLAQTSDTASISWLTGPAQPTEPTTPLQAFVWRHPHPWGPGAQGAPAHQRRASWASHWK